MKKTIIIYPHKSFNESDEEITILYYLGNLLNKFYVNVKICNNHYYDKNNNIFTKFINIDDINIDNTVVIYSESVNGNPLNAKYVVRWIINNLSLIMSNKKNLNWSRKDLIYFLYSDLELINTNVNFKFLHLFYFDKKNKNLKRYGQCYANNKYYIHSKINKIHLDNSIEINEKKTQDECITIFNTREFFISYDPFTHYNLMAAMCGCITVIYPMEGISKQDYLKMTPYNDYLTEHNTELYGIAYGNENAEIKFAKDTIHLAKQQIENMQKWFVEKYVKNFIKDIKKFKNNTNKLLHYDSISYLKENFKNKLQFDYEFYKKYNPDLDNLTNKKLIKHFRKHGKKEGRFCSEIHVKNFLKNPDFDVIFYKKYNEDLSELSYNESIHHYKKYGRIENRFYSEKQVRDYLEEPDFNIEGYKKLNPDLSNLSYNELIHHYKNFGKSEGYFFSEENFNVNSNNNSNIILNDLSNSELT
jgi:hypothetical protein